MARRKKPHVIRVTHRYVVDPEAVERGMQAWAMFLAEHLRKKVAEEWQEEHQANTLP